MMKWAAACLVLCCAAQAQDYEDENMRRGQQAMKRGDWESAASQFATAINNPEIAREGVAVRMAARLEYGRAMGVLCQFDEAEKYLREAKELAAAGRNISYRPLFELAEIGVAQKKYAAAAGYFAELMPAMEREDVAKKSPAAAIDAREKYALALEKSGKPAEAAAQQAIAKALREAHPRVSPAGVITPYGARC